MQEVSSIKLPFCSTLLHKVLKFRVSSFQRAHLSLHARTARVLHHTRWICDSIADGNGTLKLHP